MADPTDGKKLPITLAERFDQYRVDVQQIVTRGIEHPRYELKRSATISRDNLADRLDFIKLIQGLANAHIAGERLIVVGADQQERKFYDVANTDEFDPARLSQVISKYLDPQPRTEVFNSIQADGGESYVLIVFSPDQPRPIVAVSEGKSEMRIHFRLGDIWIKKDTSLQLATRTDLDAMYEGYIRRRVDEEAENRARRRFEHLREEFGPALATQSVRSAPSSELLVGARERLWRFAADAISAGDITRFKMLLEMARQPLVEKWDCHQVGGPGLPQDIETWLNELSAFYRDEFIPALESVVDLGLQVIKYDASAEWVGLVMVQLIETFEASRLLERLKSGRLASKPNAVAFAKPAYEVYIGARALATYAVLRRRFRFLKEVLPRFVRVFTGDNLSKAYVPLVFWPFSGLLGLPDMREGRNQTFWNERIHGAWGVYFGTFEKFLAAASQLEFILEFNSYVFEGEHPEAEKIQRKLGTKDFAYLPDFWTNRLDPTVPIAEHFYDALDAGSGFPPEFAIEKQAIDLVLQGRDREHRLLFLGGFLAHLRSWQSTAMMQQNRFPFMFQWEGRLKGIVNTYVQAKKAQAKKAH